MKKIILALMLCMALVSTLITGCASDETTVENGENETVENVGSEENSNAEETTENGEVAVDEPEQESVEPVVEEPKLADDIAVEPEKAEEVVNTLEFENVNLLSGIANALGKATSEVTQEDIENVYCFSIAKENTGDYTVYVGMQDYKNAVEEGLDDLYVQQFFKKSVIEIDDVSNSFADLSKFKSLEMFEIVSVPMTDISFIKDLANLSYGFFRDNGITDVSALAEYDTEKLKILDFTGNKIEDWTPLYHIQEKIVVDNGNIIGTDVNGEMVTVPVSDPVNLADKLAADAESTEEPEEENNEAPMIEFTDGEGNSADWDAFFE